MTMLSKLKCLERCRRNTFMLRVRSRSGPGLSDVGVVKMDCTLEMRQLGWAHFAGKGLQSETEAIHAEVSADGR